MEYIKHHDLPIIFHSEKANIVTDALIRKLVTICCIIGEQKLIEEFQDMDISFEPCGEKLLLTNMSSIDLSLFVGSKLICRMILKRREYLITSQRVYTSYLFITFFYFCERLCFGCGGFEE